MSSLAEALPRPRAGSARLATDATMVVAGSLLIAGLAQISIKLPDAATQSWMDGPRCTWSEIGRIERWRTVCFGGGGGPPRDGLGDRAPRDRRLGSGSAEVVCLPGNARYLS